LKFSSAGSQKTYKKILFFQYAVQDIRKLAVAIRASQNATYAKNAFLNACRKRLKSQLLGHLLKSLKIKFSKIMIRELDYTLVIDYYAFSKFQINFVHKDAHSQK
jgi:hypothetical protein